MVSHVRTADQLLRAGDLGRCELVRGELAVMNPAGGSHGRIAMLIGAALTDHVERNGLGAVFAAETGFVLSREPDTVRAPDVAFVRTGREIGDGFIEGAPDLAVEVLSPSDRPAYVRDKVAEWLEAGTSVVWVVDPRGKSVVVHSADGGRAELSAGDVLSGGSLLPGFKLALVRVFRS